MKNMKYFILAFLILLIFGCSKPKNIEKNYVEGKIYMTSIIVQNKKYVLNLENNETVREFVKILPQNFKMNELNGNEKYVYLDNILPSNPITFNHIEAGDIMLYGNNCLVIFYKSFDSTYSYTKIGHIDNLGEFGKENINVRIEFDS